MAMWFFRKKSKNEVERDPGWDEYFTSNRSTDESLVREAIQNSLDAHARVEDPVAKSQPAFVRFFYSGDAKALPKAAYEKYLGEAAVHYCAEDLHETIPELFEKCMGWLKNNLKSVQAGQEFNSIGRLEIDEESLVELLQNALLHRDYFKNAPIRVFLFDDRLEIVSPGRLPNNLTVEGIKYGNPVVRNNQLVAFASRTMPYSGLGTGVKRALERQLNIEFYNDFDGDQFKVVIPRPASSAETPK